MFVLLLALASPPAAAPAPTLSVGDTWTYDRVYERGSAGFDERRVDLRIDRVGAETMVVGIKPSGAPRDFEDHLSGLDWSQRRLLNGQQTVTGRPFAFPMFVGKTWTAEFTDPTVRGRQTSTHTKTSYRVAGLEDVTTPAGVFHAYKVVAEGTLEAQMSAAAGGVSGVTATPSGATTVTHVDRSGPTTAHATTYEELFYDPKVKYFVKTVEEQYDSNNVRVSRMTQTLQGFKVAP